MKGLFQKWGLFSVVFVFMLAFLTACGTDKESKGAAGDVTGEGASEGSEKVAEAFPVTITDDAGREVTIESEPETIVSIQTSIRKYYMHWVWATA